MSSAGKTFGTQSPPLEATGEHEVLGAASVDGGKQTPVADSKQRQEYTQNYTQERDKAGQETTTQQPQPQRLGRALEHDA